MVISTIVFWLGIISGFLLLFKHPFLKTDSEPKDDKRISVIIPARNEEKNLRNILKDLGEQETSVFEIICVDDASEDRTAEIITSCGAKLISIKDKPAGWTGKSFACQAGANAAQGELFLFLDADVRLGEKAVKKLLKAYENDKCTISVQPYHKVVKLYEQLSLFFNMIMVAANGVSLPFKIKNIGLFGPVILISRDDYFSAGGHTCVKGSVIDDLAFGGALSAKAISFKLYLGNGDISFRMYAGGISQLQQGWTKNFAAGALKTNLLILLMMILWLGACITGVINIFILIFDYSFLQLIYSMAIYVLIVLELWFGARKIGSFKPVAYIIYPVALWAFFTIFFYSMIKKLLHMKVSWKGRKI